MTQRKGEAEKSQLRKMGAWLIKRRHEIELAEGRDYQEGHWAERIGVSPGAWSEYKKGVKRPSGQVVDNIAQVFGSEIYNILELKDPNAITLPPELANDERVKATLARIKKMPPDARQEFLETLDQLIAMQDKKTARTTQPQLV